MFILKDQRVPQVAVRCISAITMATITTVSDELETRATLLPKSGCVLHCAVVSVIIELLTVITTEILLRMEMMISVLTLVKNLIMKTVPATQNSTNLVKQLKYEVLVSF